MLCANPMPRSNDASLEQRECALDGIGMNVAINVDALFVADRLVAGSMHSGFHHRRRIGGKFVRHNYFDGFSRDVFANVLRQCSALYILGMEETQFTARISFRVALPDADYDFLVSAS